MLTEEMAGATMARATEGLQGLALDFGGTTAVEPAATGGHGLGCSC